MTTSGTATARRTHAGARAVAHDVPACATPSLSLSLALSTARRLRRRKVCRAAHRRRILSVGARVLRTMTGETGRAGRANLRLSSRILCAPSSRHATAAAAAASCRRRRSLPPLPVCCSPTMTEPDARESAAEWVGERAEQGPRAIWVVGWVVSFSGVVSEVGGRVGQQALSGIVRQVGGRVPLVSWGRLTEWVGGC